MIDFCPKIVELCKSKYTAEAFAHCKAVTEYALENPLVFDMTEQKRIGYSVLPCATI